MRQFVLVLSAYFSLEIGFNGVLPFLKLSVIGQSDELYNANQEILE
jgi:hypothetical protein